MEKVSVLIPSAGGPSAVGCIKSLRLSSRRCIITSVDPNPLSAGFFLSNTSYTVPYARDEKKWIERTEQICREEDIEIIMPTSDFDTPLHSKYRELFENRGICLPFSEYKVIIRCMDKLSLFHSLKNKNIVPLTTDDPSMLDLPLIVKEKIGRGPRMIYICHRKEDLTFAIRRMKDPIFQEFLPGKEYTVDILNDLKGNPLLSVPRERLEVKAGISTKGRIILDDKLQKMGADIAKELKIKGPSCIQLKQDKNGTPKIIDVNPRLGGGTIFGTLAGINIPDLVLKLAFHEKFDIPKLREITVTRYWEEIVLP